MLFIIIIIIIIIIYYLLLSSVSKTVERLEPCEHINDLCPPLIIILFLNCVVDTVFMATCKTAG